MSAAGLPQNCQDILNDDPSAVDGVYTLYTSAAIFDAYCYDMAGSPREYLELVNIGSAFNFSQYTAGSASPGTDVRTNYTKVRIDPATLLVDIGDQDFSTSTGSLTHGGTPVLSMPYGVAMDCMGGWSQTGIANIDLRNTLFAVDDTFIVGGSAAAGSSTFSSGDQVVNLTGGGFCGWITPSPWTFNPFNTIGVFQLNLEFIGPTVVQIDIHPGDYPNCFTNNGNGVIPVAILGSSEFDVTLIDPATIELDGLMVKIKKNGILMAHIEDVNSDGIDDLVVQILDEEGTYAPGFGVGTLTGDYDSMYFIGADTIYNGDDPLVCEIETIL